MRTFTLLLCYVLSCFGSVLLAKSTIPTYSVKPEYPEIDSTLLIEDEEITHPPTSKSNPDKKPGSESVAPTWFSQPDVCGQGLGFIDLTPDPNTQGPWLFMWSNGETTEDIFNLTPGVYTVTIFDSNAQLQIAQILVQELPPVAPLSIMGNVTGNTLCNSPNGNGAIDLTVDPALPDWNYFWSNGETTEDISNLDPGVYTVSVTWGVTCTTTAQYVVPNLTNAPNLSPPIGGFGLDFCDASTGTAGVFAQGGAPPYTYEWSNGATDASLTDLPAGTYTVTVTGTNGCSSTLSGVVNPATLPVTVVENQIVYNTNCNTPNGSISITVGPPGIWLNSAMYMWSNGATTQNISNLPSGSYRVTVTRLGTCTATEVWYIEDTPALPTLSFATTSASCGNSNGAVNMTTLPGGVPPYTYLWSNGATTEDLTNVPIGTYDVTVTGSNGCTTVGSSTVEDAPPNYSFVGAVTNHNGCDTIFNGRIVLSLFPANLGYQWSNGATTTVLNNLPPGDYTVTVSAGGTCTTVETFTVANVTQYPSIPATPTASTCGSANGSADLSVFGGEMPYTYLWSNGATTQDLINVVADTFSVVVTTNVGCTAVNTVIIPNKDTAVVINGIVGDNISCATPTGAIELDVTPVDTLMVYLWSNGATTDSLGNLPAGTYFVTATLGVTCIAIDTFVVADNALLPSLSTSGSSANCGLADGAADLSVLNGVGPFTFVWSNGATTEDLANLTPGNYVVTVSGANSCTGVSSVNVLDNNIALNINGTPVENTSCLTGTGSIDINVAPAGMYTYLWSNSATTQDLNSLVAGTYSVTVSLGNCVSSSTFVVADNTPTPNVSPSITAAVCNADNGSIDLTVSGSQAPYTFLWSNNETTEDIANLLPGNYSVTVSAANGCTEVSNLNVPNNGSTFSLAGASSPLTDCANNNGAIDLSISPAGAFTIIWSNGATTEDINNLSPGTYTVSVTESGVCTGTASFFVIDQRVNPNTSQNVVPELCGLADGSIDLSVSGGTAPYGYLWSGGQISQDLANLNAGTYTVTVTDANNCTATTSAVVPGNSIAFSLAGTTMPNASCSANTGSIDLSVTPSNGSYTYLWSNTSVTQDLSNISSGTYTVTVSTVGNCTSTAEFTVGSNVPTPAVSELITAATCGQASGSVVLTVTGSPSPFTYLWSNAAVSKDLNGVVSGTYSVTVTSANGCSTVENYVVPENTIVPTIASQPTASSSCTLNNGAIDLNLNPPLTYTFIWSNGSTTEDLANIAAGTYTVTVNGGGACTNTASIVVDSDVPAPMLSETSVPATCGDAGGSIDLTVSGNSPAPYTYLWSDASTNEDLNGIVSGTYSVTVTAANGCTTVDNFVVIENTIVPAIASQPTAATSCVVNNGAIDLSINPPSAYTFIWSNGSMTEDLANIAAGTYTVTVDGGGACTNTASITVASNTGMVTLSGTPTSVLCFGGNNGAIDLTVNTGTAPYNYSWSPAIPGNPEDPSGLVSGTYTVTVTDNNDCTSTAVFSITQPVDAVQIQCSVTTQVSEPGFTDGEASVTISGGTGPYTVDWSPGSSQSAVPAGNFPITNLGENTYNVTVTDANGCPINCDFTVEVANCATAVGTMGNSPLSLCGNGCLTATYDPNGEVLVNGDALQFVLHTGNGSQIVNEIARSSTSEFCFDPSTMSYGTTYYISVLAGATDANGNVDLAGFCSVSAAGTPIQFNELPVASTNQPQPINCVDQQTALEGTSSLAGASFAWSTVSGTIVGNPNQADVTAGSGGDYTLTVTVNGCSDTATVTVASNTTQPQAAISTQSGNTLDCSIEEITLDGSVSGSTNTSVSWLNNGNVLSNANSLLVNAPGDYEFVVTDTQSLCSATATISIVQDIAPPALNIAPPGLLTCATPSQTLTGSSPVSGISYTWATIVGTDTTLVGTGPSLPVYATGTYYLFGVNPNNQCSNANSVTVNLDQTPPTALAGNPFTLDCAGETAALSGSGSGAPNLNYQWTTQDGHFVSGASTATPLIDAAGTYQLVVTNHANGCTDTDLVTITPETPIAYASVVQPLCMEEAGTIQIDSVTGLSNPILYSINNGTPSSQTQFADLGPGIYTISVSGGNGCTATVEATVEVPAMLEISLVPEAEISLGYTYQINAQVNIPASEIASIVWTPAEGLSCTDCLDPIASPSNTEEYLLTVVSNAGCEARSELVLTVDKSKKIFAPNIFSPNEDGRNDVFTIFADPVTVLRIKSLQIYSRWGEAVYERENFPPDDANIGWDGTFKGQKLNPAVFVWQAVVEFVDGQEEYFNGDVTLQR